MGRGACAHDVGSGGAVVGTTTSPSGGTAVEGEHLTGDVVGGGRRQKDRDAGEVAFGAEAPEGDA